MARIDRSLPIARLAADLPGAIAVFEALGIDYSCAGNRSLDDAAHAEGIDPDVVVAGLRRLQPVKATELWSERPLADLIHYLTTQHHRFVQEELAKIALDLADVCSRNSDVEPDMVSLRAAFVRLSETVLPHLHGEEEDVFVVVEAMERAWHSNGTMPAGSGELAQHIRHLVAEHGAIDAQLRTMRELRLRIDDISGLTAHCRGILENIARLEAHLHEYMFLENCALFPRALELASQMAQTTQATTSDRSVPA